MYINIYELLNRYNETIFVGNYDKMLDFILENISSDFNIKLNINDAAMVLYPTYTILLGNRII